MISPDRPPASPHAQGTQTRILREGDVIRETYEVERYLAEGAFAEVYRVRHRFLGRQAMKVFKQVGMTRDEIDEKMAEAALLSRIGHPNIVRVFDANLLDTPNGQYGYFTMENIPGGSLDKFWRSHGGHLVPLETTIEIVKQICRGVRVAHSEDPPIIHRDIKPQNILIGYEADGLRARLSDFGLARRVNPLTLFATAAGTLAFKPPEAFTREKGDSPVGDIWAIGVTLYLLLTDRLPYEVNPALGWGNQQAFKEKLIPPSQCNVQVNSELDRIIMACLEPRPEDRYPSAGDLLSALDGWKPGHSSKDLPESLSVSSFSKDILGPASAPDQAEAETLAQQAFRQAQDMGKLMAAADLMEEAFNKWPSLREKHATRVQLWRRGICM
jgi:serine/threonine protein kinase